MDVDDVLDSGVVDLVFGLLAECCNVELTQIVRGRVAQCAFPDDEHECTHDVFTDVFSRWVTGVLMIDESALDDDGDEVWVSPKRMRTGRRKAKRALQELKTSRLRLLAVQVGWTVADAEKAKRKQLIKGLVGPKH